MEENQAKRTSGGMPSPQKALNWVREHGKVPQDGITRWLLGMIAAALAAALLGYWIYNRVHLFDQYQILRSSQQNDVEGTRYCMIGDRILKYGHDGVFCVNTSNEVLWSIAYSMQTPVGSVCQGKCVIAEQQGRKVYILDKNGLVGNYEASMNIRKACVGAGGVTALLLDSEDTSWINLYNVNGEQIASVRATLEDTGYPLDIAITPNAKKLAVSSISTTDGVLTGNILFYDFSSSSSDRHLMQTLNYPNTVFPEVYYTSGQLPVAVGDHGYMVFSGEKRPTEKTAVTFEKEIISCFHDGDNIGFLFEGEDIGDRYQMEVYNTSGKRTMRTGCFIEYEDISAENGEILLRSASGMYSWRVSGKQKMELAYEKEVRFFAPLGSRRYLVITQDSMDQIRIV